MLAFVDKLDRLRLYGGELHQYERYVSRSGLVRRSDRL